MRFLALLLPLLIAACGITQTSPGARVAQQPGVVERPTTSAPDVVTERPVDCYYYHPSGCRAERPY